MANLKSKLPSSEQPAISFLVSSIEVLKDEINCPPGLDYQGGQYTYGFTAEINLVKDQSIIQVDIDYKFYLGNNLLHDLRVKNDFRIKNFEDISVEDDEINDDSLAFFLIDLATNHTRGIQALKIKGTPIATKYIPPIERESVKKYKDPPTERPHT